MCELHRARESDEKLTFRGVIDFVEELVVTLTNTRVYGLAHQRVHSSLARLHQELALILGDLHLDRLVLGTSEDFLFFDGRPLPGASLTASRIIQPLKALQAGGISIQARASQEELGSFIEYLGKQRHNESDYASANFALRAKGCIAVEFLPPYHQGGAAVPQGQPAEGATADGVPRPGAAGAAAGEPLLTDIPVHLYQCVVDHLQDMMVRIFGGQSIQLDQTAHFIEQILSKLITTPRSMLSICRYEQYDAYTFGHSIRVCSLALNFARTLTDNHDVLQNIGVAALMHDVGKAWVPFDILHSTARLTDEERAEMNKHTHYGARILVEMGQANPMAVAAAFGHHLAGKLQGYPRRLAEFPLSTTTKIVKICDVYEALTAVRPYKDRMSPLRAYRIMMSMGDHFDPALLRRFILVNGLYPVGSRIELESGEQALVERQTERLEAPLVEIATTPAGEDLPREEHRFVDLSECTPDSGRRIKRLLREAEVAA